MYNQKSWNAFPPWINLNFGQNEFLWNSQIRANFSMFLKNEPTDVEQCLVWRTLENENLFDGWKNLACNYNQPVVCQQYSKG